MSRLGGTVVAGGLAGVVGCVLTVGGVFGCAGLVSGGFVLSGAFGFVVVPPLAGPLGCPGGAVGVWAGCSIGGSGLGFGGAAGSSSPGIVLAGFVAAGAVFLSAVESPPNKYQPAATATKRIATKVIHSPDDDFFTGAE